MARKRTISPDLWESEDLLALSAPVRLVWVGLRSVCDRNGCFKWTPRVWTLRFAAGLLCDAEEAFTALQQAGLVERYEHGGSVYGFCPGWADDQDPHPDEVPSHPMPTSPNFTPCPPRCVTHKNAGWAKSWYAPITTDTPSGTSAESGAGTSTDTSASTASPSSPSHFLKREKKPPSGVQGCECESAKAKSPSGGKKKKTKPPAWSFAFPESIQSLALSIYRPWPKRSDGKFQPDQKTRVPESSLPLLTARLQELVSQGAEPVLLEQLARMHIAGFKAEISWLCACQNFFGKAEDAPWKPLYQGAISEREREAEANAKAQAEPLPAEKPTPKPAAPCAS